jgi:hypothetical protein
MTEPIEVPFIKANCEICEEITDFQLNINVDVNIQHSATIEASANWFCTECYDHEIPCATDIGWSS